MCLCYCSDLSFSMEIRVMGLYNLKTINYHTYALFLMRLIFHEVIKRIFTNIIILTVDKIVSESSCKTLKLWEIVLSRMFQNSCEIFIP